MKDPVQWQRVDEIFHAVLERPAAERAAYLTDACGENTEVRREVESLLEFEAETAQFIERPALEIAAQQWATDDPSALETEMPARIGVYKLHSLLGKGGMGEVWLATDSRLRRRVALKLLPAAFSRDSAMVSRFEREARAASALNHPNILTVHDIGEHNELRYIATEFVEGETLRRRLQRGRLKLAETTNLTAQIAAALVAAHQARIIHRDLKPENVMIRPDGLVKVLDFGLAKQTPLAAHETEALPEASGTLPKHTTASGVVMGTASYMSPEQARGQKADARTDIFSLGVMLHEMIAGTAPFQGHNSLEVIAGILAREPQPLTAAPPALAAIVNRALQKDREQRYQGMDDLLTELKAFERQLELHPEWETDLHEQVTAPLPARVTALKHPIATGEAKAAAKTAPVIRTRWQRMRRFAARVVAALLLIGLLTAGGVWFYDWIRKPAIDTIAVLPFANVDNNADAEYLCQGLSEALINNLSRMHGVLVSARAASFQFKGKDFDLQTAAQTLGVRALVSGRISQRNDRLQISAELIDTQTKRQLWGESYDRPANDLVAVQTEIARQVADKLRAWLSKPVDQYLNQQKQTNPEAYRLFLKAGYEAERGTPAATKKALELLNQAVVIEPLYAEAWGMMAGGYGALAYQVRTSPEGLTPEGLTKEAFAASLAEAEDYKKKSEAAAQKALELDPHPAGFTERIVRAGKQAESWDWDGAEQEFRDMLKFTPNDPALLINLSFLLSLRGQHQEAAFLSHRLYNLDPLSSSNANHYGQALMLARRYDEAIELLNKKKETNNASLMTHMFLATCYTHKKMIAEAEAEFEAASKFFLVGGQVKNSLNYLMFLVTAGRREQSVELLNKMIAAGDEDGSGIVYAMLGEKEKALTALEKELIRRTPNMEMLTTFPELDGLREEPRYQEILKRIGLYQPAP